jgi:perosamine synthetase
MNGIKYRIPIYAPTFHGNEEAEAARKAVLSGWLSHGPETEGFEEDLSKKFNCYAYSCNSGTSALHLAMISQLGPDLQGKKVLIPAITFVATANVVKYMNGEPILGALDRDYNINRHSIESIISSGIAAIIPCHLFGKPCSLPRMVSYVDFINKEFGLNIKIINDACEALGAKINGRNLHEFAVSSYSLFGNKTITCGEGGFILSPEPLDISYWRGHCHKGNYYHTDIGYNYRLNNVSAAIARVQLKYLDDHIEAKRKIFKQYNKELENIDGIELPIIDDNAFTHACWMFDIRHPKAKIIKEKLGAAGIETRPMFVPIGKLPPYRYLVAPKLNFNLDECLLLPSFAHLRESEVSEICEIIRRVVKNA